MLDDSQASARRQVIHSNFALIASAAAELGGVPAMLSAQDCCAPGGPHEHAVVGCELASIPSTHACSWQKQCTALGLVSLQQLPGMAAQFHSAGAVHLLAQSLIDSSLQEELTPIDSTVNFM